MKYSYKSSGVDVGRANKMKNEFNGIVSHGQINICTSLNNVGAFASLININLSSFKHPIFVLKSEEPGSKQLLSIENDRIEWIADDLINHLVNDIIVMGAIPCAVLDTIICGHLDDKVILRLVKSISKACENNQCILVGGETSEQPGVLLKGRYVLQASIIGIVDQDNIVDGSKIRDGDLIVSISSNGLHTNGYSLIRKIIKNNSEILNEQVEGECFLDALLKPHLPYNNIIQQLRVDINFLHGMAHITGGGIHDNLIRILPEYVSAEIDLLNIKVLPIFSLIKNYGNISATDMLAAFNVGVGMILIINPLMKDVLFKTASETHYSATEIGIITKGNKKINFSNHLNW